MFLRILRRPVLAVEQNVGDARVGLIHAHDETTRGKRACDGFRSLRRRWRVLVFGLVLRFFRRWRRHLHSEGIGYTTDLGVLKLQNAQKLHLRIAMGVVGGKHIRRRAAQRRLLDRAFALEIEVVQKKFGVVGEIVQRGQQAGLFIIVVVALRPAHFRQWRVRTVPGARVIVGIENAIDRIGAGVAESFIQAADAVMHRGHEHQVTRTPGVEPAVGEHAGHAELGQLTHVVPAKQLPFVDQDRIDPGVVGPVADGVVVQERHRFVQVVQYLRVPAQIGVEHVARQVQAQAHRVAVVVVGDVVTPVHQRRRNLARIGAVPVVQIHHAIAAVGFDHRRDQGNDLRADFLDVRRIVDGEAVRQFHQRGRRAGFGRVDAAGNVVDRCRLSDERLGLRIIHAERARIGELGQTRIVDFQIRDQRFVGDRHGDHLAAFLTLADAQYLHPRARCCEQIEIARHIPGVGQHVRCAGDIAEHLGRRRHRGRSRQIIGQRRIERRVGGVFGDFLAVGSIQRLVRIACVGAVRPDIGCAPGQSGNEKQGSKGDATHAVLRSLYRQAARITVLYRRVIG